MREQTALIKEFNSQEPLVVENEELSSEAFKIPLRNWNAIVDNYNSSNRKKFYFDALECRQIIEYVKPKIQKLLPKSVIDVGCGNGRMVQLFGNVKDYLGIDINQKELDQIDKKVNVRLTTIDEVDDKFDFVFACEVLEHIVDPLGFLNSCKKNLKDDGKLVLTVPNFDSPIKKLMGRFWYGYIVKEHLWYFGRLPIVALLEKNGYEVSNVKSFGVYTNLGVVLDRLNRGVVLAKYLLRITPSFIRNLVIKVPWESLVVEARLCD